jgi:hypothetical protein
LPSNFHHEIIPVCQLEEEGTQTLFVQTLLPLQSEFDLQQLVIGICWQTLLEHKSVVHIFGSSGQLQGATHELVSKVQLEKHFNVPVYPAPLTPAHVAPPKELPSHFSVPSLYPFGHTGRQLLSFIKLHPVGQHPSLCIQEVIGGYEQTPLEQVFVVHSLLSSHSEDKVQGLQPVVFVFIHLPPVQLSVVHPLLSLH